MKNFLLSLVLVFAMSSCSMVPTKSEYDNSKLKKGAVRYQSPEEWVETKPLGKMYKAKFVLPGQEQSLPAIMGVFSFPGAGGSIEANLNRWYKQFKQEGEKSTDELAQVEQFNLGKLPITTAYITGTFLKRKLMMDPNSEIIEKPDYAMLAAIVETKEGPWFFKITGQETTVEYWKPAFEEFLMTFRI